MKIKRAGSSELKNSQLISSAGTDKNWILIAEKIHIKKLQIYATGYDLLTLTKYKGQDPEISMKFEQGLYPMYIDGAATPKPMRFAMGLNLNL